MWRVGSAQFPTRHGLIKARSASNLECWPMFHLLSEAGLLPRLNFSLTLPPPVRSRQKSIDTLMTSEIS